MILDPTVQRHVLFVLTVLDSNEAQAIKLADSLSKSVLIFTPRVQTKAAAPTTPTTPTTPTAPKPPVKPNPKAPLDDPFKGIEG